MQQIDSFELNSVQVIALRLRAGSEIRVSSGRLWITISGHASDIWLQSGQTWRLPAAPKRAQATLWISAEPSAAFQIARPVASRSTARHPSWLQRAMHSCTSAAELAASRLGLKAAVL
jgi:hypothetical protein